MPKRLLAACAALVFAVGGVFGQGLSPLDAPPAEQPKALPPANALDKKDLEFYVRHLFLYDDRISISVADPIDSGIAGLLRVGVTASYRLAAKKHEFLVTPDGRTLIEGQTYPIAKNPFHKANETIDTASAPSFGKEGASVVLVVYSDFQCPFCAKEAVLLRTSLLHEYGSRVRVYFRDFPLQMHEWAKDAAVAGRCVYNQEPAVFWDYHDWIFANQSSMTKDNLGAKVAGFLDGKPIDRIKFTQCLKSPEALAKVDAAIAEGQALDVNSTPTIFVNGRKLGGSPEWEQLKAVIDYELKYQEVTHNAGDDCGCAAEIAFPQ